MILEALDRVTAAEHEAEKMIKDAKEEAKQIIRIAEQSGKDALTTAAQQAQLQSVQRLGELERSESSLTENLRIKAQKDIQSLNKTAEKNMERAVAIILDRMVKNV